MSSDNLPRSADTIIQALDEKRKQLDEEIAEFKATKEREYKDYEEVLRRPAHVGFNVDLLSPRSNGAAGTQIERRDAGTKEASTQQGRISETVADEHIVLMDEKEIELRSLFTPSYLPLLEGSPRNSRKQSRSPEPSPGSKPQLAPSPLSSSLTLPSTTYKESSPPNKAPSLPGSVTRPSLGQHRTSSRSDCSVISPNLRSSLRQPKSPQQEGQRDKKHVLFSINNMVISPSSSPVLQRHASSGESLSGPRSDIENRDALGHEIQEDIKIKSQFTRITPPTSFSMASPLSQSMSRSYRDLVEPTEEVTSPSPAEEADFEMNAGSDPLFEFDEDVRVSADADGQESRRTSTECSDDELADGAQSPHAGSLPIEIKWPGRR